MNEFQCRADDYRELAARIWSEIEVMGEDVARKRPYKDKKHEQTYAAYFKHYSEMADMNEKQAIEFERAEEAAMVVAQENKRRDIQDYVRGLSIWQRVKLLFGKSRNWEAWHGCKRYYGPLNQNNGEVQHDTQ